MKTNKVIRKEIGKVKIEIFMQIILTIIATVAIAYIPVFNKYLVDSLITKREFHFWGLALLYCITYCIFLISTWGSERFLWKSAIKFENELKKKCFEKLSSLSYKEYNGKKQGEYLSMLTNQITQIEQDYLQPSVALIKSVISVLIYIITIAYHTNWLICLVLLLLSILSGLSPKFYEFKLNKMGKRYVEGAAEYTKKVTDILEGFELVNSQSKVSFQKKNNIITNSLSEKRLGLGHAKVNGNTISGAMICLIDILIFIVCGSLFGKGLISTGIIVAALTYAQAFTDPMVEILYDMNMLNSSKDVVKDLETFITYQSEVHGVAEPKHKIQVDGVKIEFGSKKIQYQVSFDVNKKYILTGASGIGKTTLLNILADRVFYDGEIYIDGKKSKISEESMFYLSQDQHVFAENFEQNITIFETYKFEEKALENWMKDISVYKNIKHAQNGTLLSGGEQQILKLCRAWIQHKKIILLDEPFSALDKETRSKLVKLLNKCNAMIILVTHDYCPEDYVNWEEIKMEDVINVE